MKTWILYLALAAVAAEQPVSVRVYPTVILKYQAIRLTCRVAQDARNRWLEWGVDGYRSSRVQLDGDQARITHEWTIDRVPCDVGPPFCRLVRTDGEVSVTAQLEVGGCDQP